jgi:hypothetical protein
VKEWVVTYRSPSGEELVIRSITKPTKTRTFRTGKGLKKFRAVHVKSTIKEMVIVAKAAKKGKKDVVKDSELENVEEIEDIDDLDDIEDELEDEDEVEEDEDLDDEDEDEDEDDDEEEDEDEEEEPKPKKKKGKKQESRAKASGKVGTQEVAEAFGTDGRTLRMVLRKHNIDKDADSGRYEWSSLNHPEVKKIGKLLKGGAAKEAKQEGLDRLKATREAKKGEKGSGKKKNKKNKKKAA